MDKKTLKIMFSSLSDHYATPKHIYNRFNDYYDPCPLYSYKTDITKPIDKPMFINPPYSNLSVWVDFAILSHKTYNNHIVLLIPSRTDTKYFHRLLDYGVRLEFIKGRLKFGGSKNSAPFPSVLIHLEKRVK